MRTLFEGFEGCTRKEIAQYVAVGLLLPIIAYVGYCVLWTIAK